jgi:hypothetical protein
MYAARLMLWVHRNRLAAHTQPATSWIGVRAPQTAGEGNTGGPISVYPHSMRAPGIALSGASIEGFTKHF